MSTLTCGCASRGWTAVNDWWVCSKCHKPYEMYLEKMMSKEGITLNLFQGGPHHNEVWSVQQLLNDPQEPGHENVASWITSYSWTEQTIEGSQSGRIARVWVYQEV